VFMFTIQLGKFVYNCGNNRLDLSCFQILTKILCKLLTANTMLPYNPSPYHSSIFLDIIRKSIAMICQFLGYDHDNTMDESILGFFFSVLCPTKAVTITKFDYVEFLDGVINYQLCSYPSGINLI
jgi:hypothetical protein